VRRTSNVAASALAIVSREGAIMADLTVWSGVTQAGFAAFALALLGFSAWLVRMIIKLAQQTQIVVQANTEAITKQIDHLDAMSRHTDDLRRDMQRLRYLLEARPCLLEDDEHKQ
jgi:hypothetical protein